MLENKIHECLMNCYANISPIWIKDLLITDKSINIIGWSTNFRMVDYGI